MSGLKLFHGLLLIAQSLVVHDMPLQFTHVVGWIGFECPLCKYDLQKSVKQKL